MKTSDIALRQLDDLHTILRSYRSHDGFGWLFRGQADAEWDLLPRAGRSAYFLPEDRDLGRFNAWRKQAIAYCSLPESELEQLAMAQHHGLATRLLDWTMNPLVACYFACFESPEHDGAIYFYEMPDNVVLDTAKIEEMKEAQGVFGYIPRSIAPRLLNQKAVFTLHCDASHKIIVGGSRVDDQHPNLIRVVVPAELKGEMMELLEDYGIDRSALFPDLDGLSAHINSRTLGMAQLQKNRAPDLDEI